MHEVMQTYLLVGILVLLIVALITLWTQGRAMTNTLKKIEHDFKKALFPYVKHVDEKNDLLADALTKKNATDQVVLREIKKLLKKLEKT